MTEEKVKKQRHYGWVNFIIFFFVIPFALLAGNFVLNQKANQSLDKINKALSAENAILRQQEQNQDATHQDFLNLQDYVRCILTNLQIATPDQVVKRCESTSLNAVSGPGFYGSQSSGRTPSFSGPSPVLREMPPKEPITPADPEPVKPEPQPVLPTGSCLTDIVIGRVCL